MVLYYWSVATNSQLWSRGVKIIRRKQIIIHKKQFVITIVQSSSCSRQLHLLAACCREPDEIKLTWVFMVTESFVPHNQTTWITTIIQVHTSCSSGDCAENLTLDSSCRGRMLAVSNHSWAAEELKTSSVHWWLTGNGKAWHAKQTTARAKQVYRKACKQQHLYAKPQRRSTEQQIKVQREQNTWSSTHAAESTWLASLITVPSL